MSYKFILLFLFCKIIFSVEFPTYFNDRNDIIKIEIPNEGWIEYLYDEKRVLSQLKRYRQNGCLLYEVVYCYDDHNILIEEIIHYQSRAISNKIEPHRPFMTDENDFNFSLNYEFNFKNELIRAYADNIEIKIDYDSFSNRIKKEVIQDEESKIYFFGHADSVEIALFDHEMHLKELFVPGIKILPFFSKPSMIELQGELFVPVIDTKFHIVKLIHLETGVEHLIDRIDIEGQALISKNLMSLFVYRLKPYDPDLKLVNFGYRYYDPLKKQFINNDPFGEIQTKDLKSYCFNDPEKYIDPDGRFVFVIPLVSSNFLERAIEITLTSLVNSLVYDVAGGISTWIDQYQDRKRTDEFLKIQKGEKIFNPESVSRDILPLNDEQWQEF